MLLKMMSRSIFNLLKHLFTLDISHNIKYS